MPTRWIAGALKPAGSLTVDDGAVAALRNGKSLLPAGVVAVEGGLARETRPEHHRHRPDVRRRTELGRALELLAGAGFRRMKNLKGGINAWAREVDSSLPIY